MSPEPQPYNLKPFTSEATPAVHAIVSACPTTGPSSGAACLVFGSWSTRDLEVPGARGTPANATITDSEPLVAEPTAVDSTAGFGVPAAGYYPAGGATSATAASSSSSAAAAAAIFEETCVPRDPVEGSPVTYGCTYPTMQLAAPPNGVTACQPSSALLQQQHQQLQHHLHHHQHQQYQHQQQDLLFNAQSQSLLVSPSGSPMVAAAVTNALGYTAGAAAVGWTSSPSWGTPCVQAGCVQQPYHPYTPCMPYTHSTGFWLQGFYFASYEHLLAYRRCAIAYNYHFFGIRPHFRPPPNLPRPRRPTAGRHAGRPSTLASDESAPRAGPTSQPQDGGSGSNGDGSGDASGVGKAAEDGESVCGSPGGNSTCSTCSNGDSDDAGSDTSRSDAATAAELLVESQLAAEGPLPESALASSSPSATAAACDPVSPPALRKGECGAVGAAQGAAPKALPAAPEPSSPAAARGDRCMLPPLGVTSASSPSESTVGATGLAKVAPGSRRAALGASSTASAGSPDSDAAGADLPRRSPGRVPSAPLLPLPLPVAPLRCQGGRHSGGAASSGGYVPDQAACEAFPAACNVTSPTAFMCPTWFEPHLGGMLGVVVGEALWGADDSA